jgi:hypothetical protein
MLRPSTGAESAAASDSNLAISSSDQRIRKPSVEKEKHPTAVMAQMSADGASDGQGSSEEGERAESEENASYDHEEISEDSEDAEDYEPETGIQVRC